MTIGERIRKIRKELNLTQQEFASRIGMKRNSIAQIEIGRNTSDQTIFSICREFNVNELWLKTGNGSMFNPEPKSALDILVDQYNLTDAALALIKRFIKLKPEHQDIVAKFISELATDFGNLAVPESSNEITVEEAEAAYIKSHSRNVRKTASPALNIIDGNTGKRVKLTSCFTEYNRTHEASP